jgi:serine/threonine protein kinase
MDYLTGGTLRDRQIRERRMQPDDALAIGSQVASALAALHERGIVHRDLKPDNILFHEVGHPVLADFGIAKLFDANTQLTQLGTVLGTYGYVSPEQARGDTVDGRSDIYSLGVVIYEALAGHLPTNAESTAAFLYKVVHESVDELPSTFEVLQPVFDRALAKRPDDRFQTAREFCAALEESRRLIADRVRDTQTNDDAQAESASLERAEHTRLATPPPLPPTRIVTPKPVQTKRKPGPIVAETRLSPTHKATHKPQRDSANLASREPVRKSKSHLGTSAVLIACLAAGIAGWLYMAGTDTTPVITDNDTAAVASEPPTLDGDADIRSETESAEEEIPPVPPEPDVHPKVAQLRDIVASDSSVTSLVAGVALLKDIKQQGIAADEAVERDLREQVNRVVGAGLEAREYTQIGALIAELDGLAPDPSFIYGRTADFLLDHIANLEFALQQAFADDSASADATVRETLAQLLAIDPQNDRALAVQTELEP